MAEALAVVGIVANIIQLVDLGSRVLKRLEEYQSDLGEIPEVFLHIKTELPVLLDALRQTKTAIDTGCMQDETKKALLPAVEGCGVQIKALDNVIAEVLPVSDDSWARRRRKAFRSLRRDAKVGKITAVVRGYIQTLTFHAAASSSLLKDPLSDRKIFTEIKCISQQSASRVALVGLGGVGKSQIAIEYAYRVRDESPTTWVFWVHAGTQARFEEGYWRVAEMTRMEGWDNPKADVLRLVRNWLCDESNGRWVMIVDNVDDSGVVFPPLDRTQAIGSDKSGQAVESLSEFLPQSPNGSILITSRSRDVAYRLTGSHTYIREVKPMDEGDALSLLWKKLSFDADEHNAIELLQALDYMPLAITQAAAYIEQRAPRMTISRYLDEIRRSDHDRARLLKKDVGDSRRDGRVSNSIITTWQISFEHIRKDLPTAARLLSLMSLFDRQGIPESLLHNRYQRDEDKDVDFEEDIHTLISYSLVEMNVDGNEFEMHRLVQFSMKKWLELYDELDGWKGTYMMLMDDNYPVGLYENWAVCQALFPHAQTAVAYRPTDIKPLEAWASVLFKAAWYASEMGNYRAAQEMGLSALEAREVTLGAEHPKTLNSINSVGLVLSWQGKYIEAEAMHRRALETKERELGPEHPSTLTSMANLASTYRNQGRWKEAEELEVQVMETSARVLGEEHPDTLTSMANLASTYRNQGRWKEAEELGVQVMETRKRVLGEEHPSTLTSMANLAFTLKSQGRNKEAILSLEKCLQLRKQVLGPQHPYTISSLEALNKWQLENIEIEV
ncbi:hypothetical protein FGG08_002243 [Glutinoglossum americanum]|uniref:Kinesin light chain n=1 Tax=Glutinoglossum americanum TaxID=1670608 RepID=A0A9P8I6R0_9PEZI|nr:hypothetical protein FGG08_002243 [Glutinoglossum americanum]